MIQCSVNGYKVILQSTAPISIEKSGIVTCYFIKNKNTPLSADILSSYYLESILNSAQFSVINSEENGKIVEYLFIYLLEVRNMKHLNYQQLVVFHHLIQI